MLLVKQLPPEPGVLASITSGPLRKDAGGGGSISGRYSAATVSVVGLVVVASVRRSSVVGVDVSDVSQSHIEDLCDDER